MEIDHKNIPFSKIMDDFLMENGLTIADVKLSHTFHNEIFNTAIKSSWIRYHDSVVEYRLLCKSCNASIGDSGYRAKKRKIT
jgi:thymidine kinase